MCNIINKIIIVPYSLFTPQSNLFWNQKHHSNRQTKKSLKKKPTQKQSHHSLLAELGTTDRNYIALSHKAPTILQSILLSYHFLTPRTARQKKKNKEQYFIGNCNLKWSQLIFNSAGVWHRVPMQGHPLKSMGKRPRGFTRIFLLIDFTPEDSGTG